MSGGLLKLTKFVTDGWFNIFTGMGVRGKDKRESTTFGTAPRFDRQTLTEMYRGEGLGKRIINLPAKDMVREWLKIEGDPDGEIVNKMDKLDTKALTKEALTWSRLYGGCIVVMQINDGQDFKEPVNEDQIQDIVGLQVYDRHDIDWSIEELYQDPMNPNYGKPEIYNVSNISTGARFPVHDTRIMRFNGEIVPKITVSENQGWGDPVMTSIYKRLRGLGDTFSGIENLVTEFIMGKMTIKNLQSLIGSPEGYKLIQKRLQALDMSKSMLNTILLDEKEEFDRVAASGTQGLDALTKTLMLIIASISGIPYIKLFPEQSKGLGSEAAGNIRLYYDDIASDQVDILNKPLSKLTKYIQLSKEFGGTEIDGWSIQYNPLWQLTEKEKAETEKIVAEKDDIYYGMGMNGEVIILNRYGGDSYSSETVLPKEYAKQLEKRQKEQNNLQEENVIVEEE
jgi:phage-related protein (TIGR01555 family)